MFLLLFAAFLLKTSCNLNPSLLLKLHASAFLQPVIIPIAIPPFKDILFGCFSFGLSINSYVCFLYFGLYFV